MTSLPTIWQRWIFTGADRHAGAANHMVGIHLAVIMATFLDPRQKTLQNLSQIDETNKDSVKFKVLELKKLAEAGVRVVSQPWLSFATFAKSHLPPLPPLLAKVVKVKDLPLPLPHLNPISSQNLCIRFHHVRFQVLGANLCQEPLINVFMDCAILPNGDMASPSNTYLKCV